jgi:hypothetical protein
MEETPLINRVAESSLKTINLEHFYPKQEFIDFDLKPYLFHGLILKEKDYRAALKSINWDEYDNKIILIYCSTDAIIPVWAYMLVAGYVGGIAFEIFQGSKEEYLKSHYKNYLSSLTYDQYQDERVVIKGCSDKPVPPLAYTILTEKLKPFAQSIMYGEPCSTVPIFKRPRRV